LFSFSQNSDVIEFADMRLSHVISSGHETNIDCFQKYSFQTIVGIHFILLWLFKLSGIFVNVSKDYCAFVFSVDKSNMSVNVVISYVFTLSDLIRAVT
jgi:hypothetical protein